jgi:hypothetical protein
VRRKCYKIPNDLFKDIIGITVIQSVELYIDEKNAKKILTTLNQNRSKLRSIFYILFQGKYNNDLYGKEKFSPETRDLTALKFRLGKGKNYRIYCKEYFDEKIISIAPRVGQNKKVVLIESINKKTNELDKKLRNLLTNIGGYDYEFEEDK